MLTCWAPPIHSCCGDCTSPGSCTCCRRAAPGSSRPRCRASWTPCPAAAGWDCRMGRQVAVWRLPARTPAGSRSLAAWRLASAPALSCKLPAAEPHESSTPWTKTKQKPASVKVLHNGERRVSERERERERNRERESENATGSKITNCQSRC